MLLLLYLFCFIHSLDSRGSLVVFGLSHIRRQILSVMSLNLAGPTEGIRLDADVELQTACWFRTSPRCWGVRLCGPGASPSEGARVVRLSRRAAVRAVVLQYFNAQGATARRTCAGA